MSAPSCLVFFGVRFELREAELELVETKVDERVMRARRARLDHYLGVFYVGDRPTHLLFVGKKLASVGVELGLSAQFDRAQLSQAIEETVQKLRSVGWATSPQLFVEYQPD